MKETGAAILVLLMLLGGAASGADLEPAPSGLDARAIAEKVEDIFRGNNSYMKAAMTVVSPRLPTPRKVAFRAWDDRPQKRSFIRILAPPKDAGMAFLKLHPNLWNFIPRVERTIRIPPSMMLQSWMGSDFTNDDLVRESRLEDDYTFELEERSHEDGRVIYRLTLVPRPDAPVVWGKIVLEIEKQTFVPVWQEWYDEDGAMVRRADFADIQDIGDRNVPMVMRVVPSDKPEELSLIHI